MIIKLHKIQIRIYISKLEKRVGICSRRYDEPNKHCLLWDFDESDIKPIVRSLKSLQYFYKLPKIIILESSPKRYHAYCFAARTFLETVNILAATKQIDVDYLRLGVTRGYFTLRISPRKDSPKFELVKVLTSAFPDEMSPMDVTVNDYWTSNKGSHNA